MYCYKYENTKCNARNCPFLHCTSVEEYRYLTTGEATEHMKREVGRTLQTTNICGDFKPSVCKRASCNRRHIKIDDIHPLECPICCQEITVQSFGAAYCGHMFCYNCALRCLDNRIDNQSSITVNCPICRSPSSYKKFM